MSTTSSGFSLGKLVALITSIAGMVTGIYTCINQLTPGGTSDQVMQTATRSAWDQMQQIDLQENDRVFTSADLQRLVDRYAAIPVEQVDPIFVTHLNNSIALYKEGVSLLQELETMQQNIQNSNASAYSTQLQQQYLDDYREKVMTSYNQRLEVINDTDKVIAQKLTEKYNIPFLEKI